jgi:hypothetical protein
MAKINTNNKINLGMLQYLCKVQRLSLQEKEELKMRIAIAIEQATKE